jgi:hypothetical protein
VIQARNLTPPFMTARAARRWARPGAPWAELGHDGLRDAASSRSDPLAPIGWVYPGAARTASTKKLWRDSGYGALARHAKQPRARAQDCTSALPQPDTTGHGVELGHGAAPSVARADRRPLPVHAYSGSADVHAVVAAFVLAATPASVSAGRHRSNRFLGDG